MTRVRRAGLLLAAGAIAVALVSAVALGDSASSWRYVEGSRTAADGRLDFRLWYRGMDAVLLEVRSNGEQMDTRCQGGRLVERTEGHEVIRDLEDPEECFRLATASILGFGIRARADSRRVGDGIVDGRPVTFFERDDSDQGRIRLALDRELDLPVALETADGTYSWSYVRVGAAESVPPETAIASPDSFEQYQDMTTAEAATAFGLRNVPASIADHPFHRAFSHRSQQSTGPVYYLFWRGDDGSEVQAVLGPGVLPAEELGVSPLGGSVVFRGQEGKMNIQVVAPDLDTLRQAVLVLRPEAAGAVP